MNKTRLEAFSDAVIAIALTIMVLELHAPRDSSLASLSQLAPKFLSYVLSFVVVAVMWVNHHHIMQRAKGVDNRLLWANNGMLFSMSLIPFATAYMGEHYQEALPVAVYGVSMVLCGFSFVCFRFAAMKHYDPAPKDHSLNLKDITSSILYVASIPLAYVSVYISFAIYAGVCLMYFLPNPEKH